MKVVELTYPHQLKQTEQTETVAAIGFFDGIHKGHQKLIETAINKAKEQKRKSAVITFYPHPSVALDRESKHVNYITPLKEKEKLLSEMGVEILYIVTFNQELSKVAPEDFVDHFIIGLNVKHIVAGFDFSYGHKGKGSTETISEHSKGEFDFTVIDKIEDGNEKVSSTLIREYLKEGKVEQANQLLVRPLYIRGLVVDGDKRGRTIGYPTANLKLTEEFLLPKIGVYAVTIKYEGIRLKGMANVGYKPTFNKKTSKPSIEVHIFDYNKNLYGEELIVEWKLYIRGEQKFNGIEELVSQIQMDEVKIRAYLETI
ncbi:bifunctional riboflavin kinase/FAD synthetase [Aquibacillus halophilus]|uniref:Riboflavin biosynthesis protein n=1 Tax=Aquibacillus halophilus TaxID=930132 RepID=A0A6A8DCP6_9BACI|nr:bifunctional riboflavin kinase/FAD synthetase [Aquibacillus halophilus]MRH42306.1 bifunctional riboflavin kinase/FAD synthetase [Aquibacillus halophilus]